MAGKPPKTKPVSTPPPDSPSDSFHGPLHTSATPPLPVPRPLKPLLASPDADRLAAGSAISVSAGSIASSLDKGAVLAARSTLADYWLPIPKNLSEADAQGIRLSKQRQYVVVADEHIVQVVLDAATGLLRATQARELNPSGPLLARDSEGRFWLALENHGVSFAGSIVAKTAELFRRAGRSTAQFSDVTVARMLAVSGIDESRLRAVLANDLPVPFLLEDTLRRFALDQEIQAMTQASHENSARFQFLENTFEADCDEHISRIRRTFPDLPKVAAQAIWRDTSAAERLHLHNQPGLPGQMAIAALLALRDVRLARACEGLYLDSVFSSDSDRLALQMIGRLAAWPSKVRVEIRPHADGEVLSAIGDEQAPNRYILVLQGEGYVTQNRGDLSPLESKDLYSTVWGVLLPEQRQLFGIDGGTALRQLIRTQPLPSRQAIGEMLGLKPLPADITAATAQYRQAGQLRGGGDNDPNSPKSVVERVRRLYPQLSDEQVSSFIAERLHSDPPGVLSRLEKDFATLREELAMWNADEASIHQHTPEPQGGPTPDERRQARQRFSTKLQDIWQRKPVSRWGEGEDHFSHYVDFSGELPRLSARFEYVTDLLLTANEPGARIGAFLDSFPNVRFLGVVGIKMDEFPSGIFQMRHLSELTLDGCSLKLSEVTAEGLSRIETLTRLNLANNPLTLAPHIGYMTGLTDLKVYNTNLSSVPTGVDRLGKLQVMALHNNNISDVGDELFEIPDTQELFVGLLGNPLSYDSRQRIDHYLENSSLDRKVEIQAEEVIFESDTDSQSSESGLSTGSESD